MACVSDAQGVDCIGEREIERRSRRSAVSIPPVAHVTAMSGRGKNGTRMARIGRIGAENQNADWSGIPGELPIVNGQRRVSRTPAVCASAPLRLCVGRFFCTNEVSLGRPLSFPLCSSAHSAVNRYFLCEPLRPCASASILPVYAATFSRLSANAARNARSRGSSTGRWRRSSPGMASEANPGKVGTGFPSGFATKKEANPAGV